MTDPGAGSGSVGVVVATRNRLSSLTTSLERLCCLPEKPPIVVVDNASTDGTPDRVRRDFPRVTVVPLRENLGAGARTIGVRRLETPYVAFSDDDSWWAHGALPAAAAILDRHPRLGLVAAQVLVGSEGRVDPVCVELARSPLPHEGSTPGPAVLGFVACGAVVRADAYLDAGGFEPRLGVGGEEELLAIDLAVRGWVLCYVDSIVAHHHPSPVRDIPARRRRQLRNALWVAWMRRPAASALRHTLEVAASARRHPVDRRGVIDAVAGVAWALSRRRPVPDDVERCIRLLEGG